MLRTRYLIAVGDRLTRNHHIQRVPRAADDGGAVRPIG